MRARVAIYRDVAIAAACVSACVLHTVHARWIAAGLALVAAAAWILVERRWSRYSPWCIQGLFLLVGILMVWRFAEPDLWLTVVGIWALVAAADLSRLALRFPLDSPALDQHAMVARRVRHILLLGLATAGVIGAARVVTLQLRLVAVALLAVFVVMVVVRTIRSVAGLRLRGEDEEV